MLKRFKLALAMVLGLVYAPAFSQTDKKWSDFAWADTDPRFGGFSSVHVFEGGERFYATTDKGSFAQGTFERNTDGTIKGVSNLKLNDLKDDDGTPLSRYRIDAEGIAVRSNGRIYVSFESVHRVWTYSSPASEGAWMPLHPDFKGMKNNSSLEALAIDRQNRLYTIPERSGLLTRPFPVYRYANGAWKIPFSIPRRGEFLVVGADIGPDNRLYLLERDFNGWRFQTRLRRFDLSGREETEIFTSNKGQHDNLEGVSVWRNDAGQLIATMISDDNFRFLQRTEFVEYLLPE